MFGMLCSITKGVHRSDKGPLGPVTSICATLANTQTDRWMEERTMLDYAIFAD